MELEWFYGVYADLVKSICLWIAIFVWEKHVSLSCIWCNSSWVIFRRRVSIHFSLKSSISLFHTESNALSKYFSWEYLRVHNEDLHKLSTKCRIKVKNEIRFILVLWTEVNNSFASKLLRWCWRPPKILISFDFACMRTLGGILMKINVVSSQILQQKFYGYFKCIEFYV